MCSRVSYPLLLDQCIVLFSVTTKMGKKRLQRPWSSAIYSTMSAKLKNTSLVFRLLHLHNHWILISRDEFELEFYSSSSPSCEESELSQAELGHFIFRAETELTVLTICMPKNSKFLTYFPILLLYHDSNQFQLVLANFQFRAEVKKVTTRAENPSARAMDYNT